MTNLSLGQPYLADYRHFQWIPVTDFGCWVHSMPSRDANVATRLTEAIVEGVIKANIAA